MLKIDYDYTSKSGIDGGDGLMGDYIQYLSELIPEKDSLKIVKTESARYYKEHSACVISVKSFLI